MRLDDAEKIAAGIVETIKPFCEKVEVAGSIRRKRPEIRDIDIVLIPKPFSWDLIIHRLCYHDPSRLIKQGPKLATVSLPVGISVDLYVATPETWGVLLLIRTGSKEHNIRLCSLARSKGLMLSAARGVIQDGKVIASRTEAEIFHALDLPFIEPRQREIKGPLRDP